MTARYLRPAILVLGCLLFSVAAPAQAATDSSKKAQNASTPAKSGQQDLAASDLRTIKNPALPEFHPQQPKRIQLENGMVIFLQEDHELPLIDGVAYIRGGSKEEPAGKVGLASIYGASWRTGG